MRPPSGSLPQRSRRRQPRRERRGYAVAAPGLYVWEATAPETAWAYELADYARALRRPPRLR